MLNSAHFFVHFFHVKPPSETSQLHVLWRKCRCAHSEFCCLCFCSLFSFFTAAHFHLAFVQILTASIKFSCCSSNEIRLPWFLSLALAFCRYFSRWALLPCRLLSRFLCLCLSLYSKFVDITIFMHFRKKTPLHNLPDLGSDESSVWNFCARFSDVIWRENQWLSVAKCRLFSQAILDLVNVFGNVFAHHRKICANRHSAKIPMELYLRTFANKWDWFCSRIQKYILGGFLCNIRV